MIAKAISNTVDLNSIKGRFMENSIIYIDADRPFHVFSFVISKRMELESWDWSQIVDNLV